jgi:hypothetical protein
MGPLGWDKRRFKFLRDRADPRTGALTQLLAHSCNMDPPKVGPIPRPHSFCQHQMGCFLA